MGYVQHVPPVRLELPSDPQWWIEMREAKQGDIDAGQKAAMQITDRERQMLQNGRRPGQQMQAELDAGAYLPTIAARLIVRWNLTDADDQPLPISVKSIALLNAEDGQFVMDEVQERLRGRDPLGTRSSAKPSSESSPQVVERPTISRPPAS